MTTIALIRCTQVGPYERALQEQLKTVFPGAVHFVVDALVRRPPDLPAGTILVTPELVNRLGMRVFPNAGWQMGDYCYYAAREALAFDFAWLIESDVGFTFARLGDFFDLFADDRSDLLVNLFGTRGWGWMWTQLMAPVVGRDNVYGGSFPITRLSRRAIDHLIPLRSAYLQGLPPDTPQLKIANDEAFVASILKRDGFVCTDMGAIAPPETFALESFSTSVCVMPEELSCPAMANRVVHSVRTAEGGAGKLKYTREKDPNQWEWMHNRVLANLGPEAWDKWTALSYTLPD